MGFVICIPRLFSPHRQTTPTSQNRKEGGRNNVTNQDVLPHPPRGVCVE